MRKTREVVTTIEVTVCDRCETLLDHQSVHVTLRGSKAEREFDLCFECSATISAWLDMKTPDEDMKMPQNAAT